MTEMELKLLALIIKERIIRCLELYSENYENYTITGMWQEHTGEKEIGVQAHTNAKYEIAEFFRIDISEEDFKKLKKLLKFFD